MDQPDSVEKAAVAQSGHQVLQAGGLVDRVTRGEQVGRVEAHPDLGPLWKGVRQDGQFLQAGAHGVAGSGAVLQQERRETFGAAEAGELLAGLLERQSDCLDDPGGGALEARALVRPHVSDHPGRSGQGSGGQGVCQGRG